MATITKTIRVSDYCPTIGTKACTYRVSGDTSYASYSVKAGGTSECSNCRRTTTSCIVADICPYLFSRVSWDSQITSGGKVYKLKSTSGGANSSVASAVYENEVNTYNLKVTHSFYVIYSGSTTRTYSIDEGETVTPSDYDLPAGSFTGTSRGTDTDTETVSTTTYNCSVVDAVDNSTLKSSTTVYKSTTTKTRSRSQTTTVDNNDHVYQRTPSSSFTMTGNKSITIKYGAENYRFSYGSWGSWSSPSTSVNTNLDSITGISSKSHNGYKFYGYSYSKGLYNELGTTEGTINRPSSGWKNGTIYANYQQTISWEFIDKEGQVHTGNILEVVKDGVTTRVDEFGIK